MTDFKVQSKECRAYIKWLVGFNERSEEAVRKDLTPVLKSGEVASLCSDERSEEQTTAGRHEVSAEVVQADGAKRRRLNNADLSGD